MELERAIAYSGELNYFKQGAYNQTNGKAPEKNMVWSAGAETYGGDITKQYANGCYTEVWFRNSTESFLDSETIRIGSSNYQNVNSGTTVSNNYFVEADGENEIITQLIH